MIDHSDQKWCSVFINPIFISNGTQDWIRFIRQSEYHIRTAPLHLTKFINKPNPIKNMAGVDKKSHERKFRKRCTRHHHWHHYNLHSSGIYNQAWQHRPKNTIPSITHQHSERNSNKQIGKKMGIVFLIANLNSFMDSPYWLLFLICYIVYNI